MMPFPQCLQRSLQLLCIFCFACGGTPKKRSFSPIDDSELPENDRPNQSLPTARSLFERHVEAAGGRAAYAALTTRYTKALFITDAEGARAVLQIWEQAPNKIKMEVSMDGKIIDVSASAHGISWSRSLQSGLNIAEGDQLKEELLLATFHSYLRHDDMYASIETVGRDVASGRPAFKVQTISPTGRIGFLWFDSSSGLMIKEESIRHASSGQDPSTTNLLDYRVVDGIATPHRIQMNWNGIRSEAQILECQHNIKIPDEVFAIPNDVRRILESRNSR